MLTLNIFEALVFCVSVVDFEQVNVSWVLLLVETIRLSQTRRYAIETSSRCSSLVADAKFLYHKKNYSDDLLKKNVVLV